MNKTGISWTDYTWNPVSGCTKVSEGCKFCYAEAWSKRWNRSFDVTLHPEKLKEVDKIPAGSKVFVNSMSDLFHPAVPTSFINRIMKAIASRPDTAFQILTKRPEEIGLRSINLDVFPDNMWLGVSVEMEKYIGRIGSLLESDWKYNLHHGIKFVSFEPLIGDIGVVKFDFRLSHPINWIIIGGESGPHHRSMNIEWAKNLVRQAREQNVAIWIKQLGGLWPGGNLEDLPDDLRIREFPVEMSPMETVA